MLFLDIVESNQSAMQSGNNCFTHFYRYITEFCILTHSNYTNIILRHEYEIALFMKHLIFQNWPATPATYQPFKDLQ